MAPARRRKRKIAIQRGKRWYENFSVPGRRFRSVIDEATDEASATRIAAATMARALEEAAQRHPGRRGPVKMTIDEAAARHLLSLEGKSSAYQAAHVAETFIALVGGDVLLSEVQTADVSRWVVERLVAAQPQTVNVMVGRLRAVFNYARRAWNAAVPEIDWKIALRDAPEFRRRVVGDGELERVLGAIHPDYHDPVLFAYLTGVRLANVVALRWQQIDWLKLTITFRVKSRKPGGKLHTIPMDDQTAAVLRRQPRSADAQPSDLVWTYAATTASRNQRRKVAHVAGQRYPVTRHLLNQRWHEAKVAAGCPDLRFHDLRRSMITEVIESTGNVRTAQELAGHADASTTLRYCVTDMGRMRAAQAQRAQKLTQLAAPKLKAVEE